MEYKLEKTNKKKAWLDRIFYQLGKQNYDYELNYMVKKDGIAKSTKWIKYSEAIFPVDAFGHADDEHTWRFFTKCNNRRILPNEIVLDLEEIERYKDIRSGLDSLGLKYYLYKSGSRGIHFHLYFDGDLTLDEKAVLIRKFGCDEQKAISKCMIALEFTPHWKTGRDKKLINYKEFPSEIEINKRKKLHELQQEEQYESSEQESDQYD